MWIEVMGGQVDLLQSLSDMESNVEHSNCHGSTLWYILFSLIQMLANCPQCRQHIFLSCIYSLSHSSLLLLVRIRAPAKLDKDTCRGVSFSESGTGPSASGMLSKMQIPGPTQNQGP